MISGQSGRIAAGPGEVRLHRSPGQLNLQARIVDKGLRLLGVAVEEEAVDGDGAGADVVADLLEGAPGPGEIALRARELGAHGSRGAAVGPQRLLGPAEAIGVGSDEG